MGVKPGYKQTEVGIIPEEWDVQTIGQMFRLINGCAFKPDDWKQSGTPIIRIQNLNDPSAEFNYSQSPVPERNRIEAGDLLFAWSGTLGSSFGARVWNGPSGVLNQHIFKVLKDEQQITLPFSLLVFSRVDEDIAKQAHGFKASFVHVKKSDLVKVDLPLPPLQEQRAIATGLSDADGLLGGLDRLIAKKRDLKQAAMQQLLTGQTRLPGFHGEWEVKTIQELAQVGRGRVISHTEISRSSTPTYPVFSSQTSERGIMGYLDTYDFEGDYVTWTTDGANAGTVFARSGRFNCTNVCGTIRLHDSDHRFIAAALGRVSQSHVSRHLGNPKLMNDVMKKIKITIPKTRTEQTAIASVLTEMDSELAVLEQRREKTRALKLAMMQELLTGRTRLVSREAAKNAKEKK